MKGLETSILPIFIGFYRWVVKRTFFYSFFPINSQILRRIWSIFYSKDSTKPSPPFHFSILTSIQFRLQKVNLHAWKCTKIIENCLYFPTRMNTGLEENIAIISKQEMVQWGTSFTNLDSLNIILFLSFKEKLRQYILANNEDIWRKRIPLS